VRYEGIVPKILQVRLQLKSYCGSPGNWKYRYRKNTNRPPSSKGPQSERYIFALIIPPSILLIQNSSIDPSESMKQAQIVINQWLRQSNHIRPHQALNMRPPVPETLITNGIELGGETTVIRRRPTVNPPRCHSARYTVIRNLLVMQSNFICL